MIFNPYLPLRHRDQLTRHGGRHRCGAVVEPVGALDDGRGLGGGGAAGLALCRPLDT